MNPIIAALDRARRGIRRTAQHLIVQLTRKASIKVTIAVSLPPFLKLALDYKTELGRPANDNQPRGGAGKSSVANADGKPAEGTARPRRRPRRTA